MLPALTTNPEVILFTDFDGTVTLQDSNNYLTDNFGMGPEHRQALNDQTLRGEATFRDTFKQMLDSIDKPFSECAEELYKNVQLDPGFADFYHWALSNNVPVIVVSSGMEPLIRGLLVKLVGEEAKAIPIVSNNVKLEDGGKKWSIVYHDDSDFGHDKSLTIRPYAELKDRPTLFYAGDGVSDVSAAKEADLLFAKAGEDLITYCKNAKVPFREFHSFKDIHKAIQDLVEGKTTVAKLKAQEHE